MAIITTGDDAVIPVRLKKKGAFFSISSGAEIKAVLTTLDRKTIISNVVTVNNAADGTDLANSLFIVEFTEAETLAILDVITIEELGEIILEVQVKDPKKTSWTMSINVVKGNIT